MTLSVIHHAVPDKKVKKMCEEKIMAILADTTTIIDGRIPKLFFDYVDLVLDLLQPKILRKKFYQKQKQEQTPEEKAQEKAVADVSNAFTELDTRMGAAKSLEMGSGLSALKLQVMGWMSRAYKAHRASPETDVGAVNKYSLETEVEAVNKLQDSPEQAATMLVETLVKAGIKIIALDFDYTMIQEHTSLKGYIDRQIPDDAKKLTTIATDFKWFAGKACDQGKYPNLKVVVATMSDNEILERIRNDKNAKQPITKEQWDRHLSKGDLLAGEALVFEALKKSGFEMSIGEGKHIDAVFGFNPSYEG
eukprot:GHVU01165617.1.p1 GENE.GHVU01165617.1~~GHVU01165617.1.p1  ORF type:complete len:306 (+),score=50.95 GHVU01165617.1:1108-2025(+)